MGFPLDFAAELVLLARQCFPARTKHMETRAGFPPPPQVLSAAILRLDLVTPFRRCRDSVNAFRQHRIPALGGAGVALSAFLQAPTAAA